MWGIVILIKRPDRRKENTKTRPLLENTLRWLNGTYHHRAIGTSLSIKNKQHRKRVCVASIYIWTKQEKKKAQVQPCTNYTCPHCKNKTHKKNINKTNESLESLTNYIKRRSFSVPADYNNCPMLYSRFVSLFRWHAGPLNGQVN